MTGKAVTGSRNGARSGAQTLVLLSAPLNCLILNALADGPRQQAELRQEAGSPAQTTLRAKLRTLVDVGAVEKRRRNRFPGVLEYELTAPGRDLLLVSSALESWLGAAPEGGLTLGSNAAKATVKALAEGWSTTMVRALAAGPLSLTELDGVISSLSYPALERRLAALRLAGLVETRSSEGRGTPYAVTEWLRRGIAPLGVAAAWERRHAQHIATPVGRLEAEAAFLLAVPMLRLPAEATGRCRLAVEIANGGRRLGGVTVVVEGGRIVACTTQLEDRADAWALGPASAWLSAVIDRDARQLEIGGDCSLARALIDGLHQALFERRQDNERPTKT